MGKHDQRCLYIRNKNISVSKMELSNFQRMLYFSFLNSICSKYDFLSLILNFNLFEQNYRPVGIMVAGAKGVLRSMLCNGDFKGECIPVDFAINGIIGIAKSVATMKEK